MNTLLIVLLAGLVWAWIDALRAREAALRACRRLSEHLGLQLLDETVALRQVRLARDLDGHARLRRRYHFEYTENGNERLQGEVVLLGGHVESVRGNWIEGSAAEHTAAPDPAQTELTHMPSAPTTESDKVVRLSELRTRKTAMRDDRERPH